MLKDRALVRDPMSSPQTWRIAFYLILALCGRFFSAAESPQRSLPRQLSCRSSNSMLPGRQTEIK